MYVDKYMNIFVADSYNHRIIMFEANSKTGVVVAGGNGKGNKSNQLSLPTSV